MVVRCNVDCKNQNKGGCMLWITTVENRKCVSYKKPNSLSNENKKERD